MAKSIEAINRFVDQIEKRGLPIEIQDAFDFGYAIVDAGFSPKKLKILAGQLNFIPRDVIDDGLYQIAKKAKELISEPYAIIRYPAGGSAVWVYQQLLDHGIPEATEIISLPRGSSGQTNINRKQDEVKLLQERNKVNSFWIFDDFGYSGGHARTMVEMSGDATSINAGFVGLSARSRSILQPACQTILSPRTIRDVNHLRKTPLNSIESLVFGLDSDNFNFLTWSEIRVPDNLPDILTGNVVTRSINGSGEIPPLIRVRNFVPPYKSFAVNSR